MVESTVISTRSPIPLCFLRYHVEGRGPGFRPREELRPRGSRLRVLTEVCSWLTSVRSFSISLSRLGSGEVVAAIVGACGYLHYFVCQICEFLKRGSGTGGGKHHTYVGREALQKEFPEK